MIEKKYDPSEAERRIYDMWESKGLFKPTVSENENFSIVMPPPNVTGSLHMGHALNTTLQDIIVRYQRMKGKNVLWQPGTDHAGIATQMVVERNLQSERNVSRRDLGRETFVNEIWKWKEKSGGTITEQLRRLGASCDWSRERFTMDDGLSEAVIKVFVELYNDGLIYKDKRLVNWDPKLKTAISDLEVDQRETKGSLWYINYPLQSDETKYITIATTRPETMFGDTAIAVHPKDERYKDLVGQKVLIPIVNRQIPIVKDEYADPEQGSGAVKITPAHDFNDFEVGKRHNLEFINIFDEYAKCNESTPKQFQGLDRFEARKKIIQELSNLNLLLKEEKQLMVVPYGDRSGVIIEPWLTDQWFCDAKKLSVKPILAVKNGDTEIIPKQWEKTFYNWMENIQPWCISRQLWWGHQIPAWYGPDKKIFVAENVDEAKKEAFNYYKKDTVLSQDGDVLDTWFSSALWTFSTLDWPEKSYELERFYPGNVLVTGFDIIFFWVARMMMMGSYFMKNTPFKQVYIHPLIRDEKGQKMSKSKGNVIDPLDLLDKYGADTLRFTLAALMNPGRDVKLSESRVKGYKSFTNKIWNASKFLKINNCNLDLNFKYSEVQLPVNQWIINELASTVKKIDDFMSKYLFHEVGNELYHFIWHTYCDWYVEFAKSLFQDDSNKSKETKDVSIWVFLEILKIAHPIMPFITEKLWNSHFNKDEYLMNQQYINIPIQKNYIQSQFNFKNLTQIISAIRNLRSELNIPYKDKIDLFINNSDNDFINFLNTFKNEIIHLLKLNNLSFNTIFSKSDSSAYIVISNSTLIVPLEGVIDTNEEIGKLNLKKKKESSELINLQNKLNNPQFIAKAPKNIIEQFKMQSEEIKSSIEKIDQIINTIK